MKEEVSPQSRDPNVVGNVLGAVTGLAMVAGAAYLYLENGPRELMLPLAGFGVLTAVVGAYGAVSKVRDLRRAGVTDPMVILKEDMRPRDEIVRRLFKLVLLWAGLFVFFAFVLSTPSEAPGELLSLAGANPLIAVGVVVLNLVLVVATMFVRRGSGTTGGGAF